MVFDCLLVTPCIALLICYLLGALILAVLIGKTFF
jgi:glycerol-3-phosphate acyltransferase PlsY